MLVTPVFCELPINSVVVWCVVLIAVLWFYCCFG